MKNSTFAVVASLVLLLAPGAARAAVPNFPAVAIDSAVRSILKASKTPAASIAVVENGHIVYARGYGLRDVAGEFGADANTRYEIGSMTKQFTAAAIMQLRDAGKLSLDERVANILPTAPHAKEITIRELLTHTSGLRNYTDVSGFVKLAAKPGSYQQMIALIAKLPLKFKPGSHWSYSNTNYILLGRIVEVLSHEPYQTYVREHEFTPAGMTHTGWISDEARLSDMALGYQLTKSGKVVKSPPLRDIWAWSAGSIVTTVGDFARWTNALDSGKIVPLHDYAEMTTPVKVPHGSSGGYGFGLVRDTFERQPRIAHDGGTFGFASSGARFPAQHLAIVAFTNSGDGPASAIVNGVFNALHPKIASVAARAVPGEDLAFTARVKALLIGLLHGKLDRSEVTAKLSKRLSPAFLASADAQLAPLGAPKAFIYRGKKTPPGFISYTYLVKFATQTLKLNVSVETKTKKFAGVFLSAP